MASRTDSSSVIVRRSQCLPEPAEVPASALAPLVTEMRNVVRSSAMPRQLIRDPDAKALWATVYPKLSEGEPRLVASVLARAEAHVLRLSILYAALPSAR
jgi:hypothetical protein